MRFEDLGTHDERSCDYPDFAHALARGIDRGPLSRSACWCAAPGIGMSIAANRHPGRARRGVHRALRGAHDARAQRRQRAVPGLAHRRRRAWPRTSCSRSSTRRSKAAGTRARVAKIEPGARRLKLPQYAGFRARARALRAALHLRALRAVRSRSRRRCAHGFPTDEHRLRVLRAARRADSCSARTSS